MSGVLSFIRDTNQNLIAPELLGLPATSGKTERVVLRGREALRDALLMGDEEASSQIIFDLWLSGQRVCEICDQVISGAFVDIGEKWACNEAQVYQERRACEIIIRILHELRMRLKPSDSRMFALGGSPEGDQYVIPTTAVELVLRDVGWQARSLGSSIPFDSLSAAIREHRPQLFWLSVSYIHDRERFVQQFAELRSVAAENSTNFVAGGYAIDQTIREKIPDVIYCDSMRELEQFAYSLHSAP